jgi:polyisoprenoid-binding protein YceI
MSTREYNGIEVPAAGTYVIDDAHSNIEFVGRHMMVTKVRGRFEDFTGQIVVDEDPTKSRAEVHIKTSSLNTRNEGRDDHLRSADFMDVETYPTIEFKTGSLEHVSGNKWRATGDLSVRGVTKPIALDVEFGGGAKSPWGQDVVFFSGRVEIDREHFGMTWNQALETGGWLVGKKVVIEVEAEGILQTESAEAISA